MIIILNYHSISDSEDIYSVSKEDLDKQLEYFNKKYQLISLEKLVEILEKGVSKINYGLVTFDDGYQDNLLNALPVLEKYQIPATFFISAGLVGESFYGKQLLTWDEIKRLNETGLITIGSHGMAHENYVKLTTEQAMSNLKLSKKIIEDKLSKEIFAFAFPYAKFNGNLSEINQNTYRLIFSQNGCLFSNDYSLINLPRVTISQNVSFLKFKFLLTNIFWFLKKVIK